MRPSLIWPSPAAITTTATWRCAAVTCCRGCARPLQSAIKHGVKIVTGADTSYGPASVTRISHEVAAFVDMGMKPLQALQSATTVAADLLAITSRVGAIEPGLEADLVVVERNPLEQVRTLDDPLLIVSNGRLVVNRLTFGRQAAGSNGGPAR